MDSSSCVGTGGRPRWLMILRSMAWLCSIVASARANLWSSDACVVASEQTASITAASSLELTRTCSRECCAVYEGPGVSAGAGAEGGGGGDGGDKSGTRLLSTSTSTSGIGSSPLGGSSATSSGTFLLVLLLEEKRDRHNQGSLHGKDLRASDPSVDTGLLRKSKMP